MKTTSPKKFVKIHFLFWIWWQQHVSSKLVQKQRQTVNKNTCLDQFIGDSIMIGSERILERLGCSQARMDWGSTLVWNTWSYKKDITTLAQEHLIKTVVRVVFLSTREPKHWERNLSWIQIVGFKWYPNKSPQGREFRGWPKFTCALGKHSQWYRSKNNLRAGHVFFFFKFTYNSTGFLFTSPQRKGRNASEPIKFKHRRKLWNWLWAHSSVIVTCKVKYWIN